MSNKNRKQDQQRQKTPPRSETLSTGKKTLFTIIMVLFPVVFLVVLEMILLILGYGANPDLFITASDDLDEYYRCNPDIGQRYFFVQSIVPGPGKDIFLKKKPQNGYRIFVLGGSTAAGFPYKNNLVFSRILHHRLIDVFPEKHIEVINTAMSAVNSFTLLDFMDEILEQEPDAILIYTGHNEYYGALGVGSRESIGKYARVNELTLTLRNYRTFALMREIIGKLRLITHRAIHNNEHIDPQNTLMAQIVGEQTIPYRSHLYELGKNQFERNLMKICKKASEADVEILLSEVVSNFRDHKPFISIDDDSLTSANYFYQKAKRLDSESGFAEAKDAYYKAKDLDALRFRATEDINEIIHHTAASFQIPVVPLLKYYEEVSPEGIIGNNLILEHLHPNITGYFLMADAFFRSMKDNGFIEDSWDKGQLLPVSYYQKYWGVTRLDTLTANLNIYYLKGGWPFQPLSKANTSLENYTPKTKVESLAFRVLMNNNFSLEQGHLELAKYYEAHKQTEKALNEYIALFYMVPYEEMFIKNSFRILSETKQYQRALPLLYKSLKFRETAFANKWIGQILLTQKKFNIAIPFLENARTLEPTDTQVLYNLGRIYFIAGQVANGQEVLSQLKRISPNSRYIRELEQIKYTIQNVKDEVG